MGGNIVTAIANGSAPYLANEVKNQIQGNSVESDIQRTVAHGLVNAGLALAKGENAAAQAAGAMTGETMGILSHSLYGKTPEELTESEKQNISAWATLASGIVGGLISDNSAGVANAAQAGKVVVENNFLSPDDRDVRDKALEDQKAGRNLKEASQNIIYLSDKDAYTDRLVDLYLKGELDSKGQIALAEYLDAVGIQLQLRGLSESDTKIQIENILKYPARFKDTRSAYYDALGYLSTEERHAWQAMIGTDALLAGPGRASQLMRLALISGGSYQTGTGLAQIADGKIAEGSINVGLGGLAVSGGYLGNKVTGKSNGEIVSPENHVWQENTLVKYPFYDKPQQGGTLNIGAGNKPIEGAYNISHPDYPKGTGVYAGDVNNLSNIATGSQKTIIMENPYGFKPFHDEVLRVLDKNGIIVVKGSWNNPVIKKIENEAKKHGFVLTEKNVIPSAGFSQTDGKPINNLTITEYKFKKGDDK